MAVSMRERQWFHLAGAGAVAALALAAALVVGQLQPTEVPRASLDVGTGAPAAGIALVALANRAVVESGVASWYGAELAGALTASGAPFDPEALTAAHPVLPFGTLVTVVNLDNGRAVEVEINDRGPFADDRIIDVSRAAARALGFKEDGTAEVQLEVTPEVLAAVASSEI